MTAEMIDLDALRAARDEVDGSVVGPAPVVVYGGKRFDLPSSMPTGAFMRMAYVTRKAKEVGGESQGLAALDGMYGLLRALFGERVDEFLDLNPTDADIEALMESLAPTYGVADPKDSTE